MKTSKLKSLAAALLAGVILTASGCSDNTPVSKATTAPSAVPAATQTPASSPSPTPTVSPSPTPIPTPVPTPEPTREPAAHVSTGSRTDLIVNSVADLVNASSADRRSQDMVDVLYAAAVKDAKATDRAGVDLAYSYIHDNAPYLTKDALAMETTIYCGCLLANSPASIQAYKTLGSAAVSGISGIYTGDAAVMSQEQIAGISSGISNAEAALVTPPPVQSSAAKSSSSGSSGASSAAKSSAGASSGTDSSETVYITPTGKKYHRAGCRTIKKSSTPISRSQAEARGYGPCKVCH